MTFGRARNAINRFAPDPPGLATDHSMDDVSPPTTQMHGLLERFAAGDPNAPDALIRRSCERLRQLTHHMLRGYPGVKRWAETDDVLQIALMRLLRCR